MNKEIDHETTQQKGGGAEKPKWFNNQIDQKNLS